MSHDDLAKIPYYKSMFSYGSTDANLAFDDMTVKHVMAWIQTGVSDINTTEFMSLIDYLCLNERYAHYVTERMLRLQHVHFNEEIIMLVDPLIIAYYVEKLSLLSEILI